MNIIEKYNLKELCQSNYDRPIDKSKIYTIDGFDLFMTAVMPFTINNKNFYPGDLLAMKASTFVWYSSCLGLDGKVVIINDNYRESAI